MRPTITIKSTRGARRQARRLAQQNPDHYVLVETQRGLPAYDAFSNEDGLNAGIWNRSRGRCEILRPCPRAGVQWQWL